MRSMSSEDQPSEEKSYDLRGSTALVGQLYPVLRAKDGSILDGIHRNEVDGSWRSEVLEKIDSEEKKLAARLIANFHRRRISREEKATWINGLATLYQSQGFKVFKDGDKSQGSNEIAERIAEVTGIHRRTVNTYLKDDYKQSNKVREDHENAERSKASEILFNALAGRSHAWAKRVLERYQEELLQSPIFRARVLAMLPKCDRSAQRSRGIRGLRRYRKHEKTSGENPGNSFTIDMDAYYKMFIEECPQCICATCPHADTCIERVTSDE